ncbi:MAG: histidine triad nucleotide-binding protein [Aeriscardovia sp.]|nr:histidine triad nucleotide-binding protein [Aeriscardovia sp.]
MCLQDDCIFCKILEKKIPSTPVYEDNLVYAFNDINPKAAIHVLIIPKKHIQNVTELSHNDPQTLLHIIDVAQQIADKEFHGSYRLIFNTGKEVGQSVFHVHAHVLTGEYLSE